MATALNATNEGKKIPKAILSEAALNSPRYSTNPELAEILKDLKENGEEIRI